MADLKIDINLQVIKIYFNKEKYKYFTDNHSDFISMTTFIKQFFPKFDRERISERYVIKKHSDRRKNITSMG